MPKIEKLFTNAFGEKLTNQQLPLLPTSHHFLAHELQALQALKPVLFTLTSATKLGSYLLIKSPMSGLPLLPTLLQQVSDQLHTFRQSKNCALLQCTAIRSAAVAILCWENSKLTTLRAGAAQELPEHQLSSAAHTKHCRL